MSSQYFPPFENTINNINVRLDLTNYALKTMLKI